MSPAPIARSWPRTSPWRAAPRCGCSRPVTRRDGSRRPDAPRPRTRRRQRTAAKRGRVTTAWTGSAPSACVDSDAKSPKRHGHLKSIRACPSGRGTPERIRRHRLRAHRRPGACLPRDRRSGRVPLEHALGATGAHARAFRRGRRVPGGRCWKTGGIQEQGRVESERRPQSGRRSRRAVSRIAHRAPGSGRGSLSRACPRRGSRSRRRSCAAAALSRPPDGESRNSSARPWGNRSTTPTWPGTRPPSSRISSAGGA